MASTMNLELRKRLYELDEIGFIGTSCAKETEKVEIIMSYLIQASKKMWKEQSRSLTDAERELVIKEAEHSYKRRGQQGKKTMAFAKVASVAL